MGHEILPRGPLARGVDSGKIAFRVFCTPNWEGLGDSFRVKGYIFVAWAAILWASSGVAGKWMMREGLGLMELVQFRASFATLLLGIWLLAKRRDLLRLQLRDLPVLAILGFLMALNNATYFYAIGKIQVGAAILLQYMAPVFVAVYAMAFWSERITVPKSLALVSALAGCYLVVGGYNLELLKLNKQGLVGGVAAALCFSAYTLLSERGMHRHDPWTVLFYAMLTSAIFWHVVVPPGGYAKIFVDLTRLLGILWVAVMGTVLPFALYLLGINYLRSTRAIVTATLEPISAGLISFLILGEVMEGLQVIGGLLVIAAIVILQVDREQQVLAPEVLRRKGKSPPSSHGWVL